MPRASFRSRSIPDKIRDVIGKGGVTIRSITEETGATVDISDDGTVKIFSVDKSAGDEARKRVELITADVEVGMIYEGRVARLMDFGAFVTILPGKDGLVHISQISDERVEKVSDKLNPRDVIKRSRSRGRQAGAHPSQHEGSRRRGRGLIDRQGPPDVDKKAFGFFSLLPDSARRCRLTACGFRADSRVRGRSGNAACWKTLPFRRGRRIRPGDRID